MDGCAQAARAAAAETSVSPPAHGNFTVMQIGAQPFVSATAIAGDLATADHPQL